MHGIRRVWPYWGRSSGQIMPSRGISRPLQPTRVSRSRRSVNVKSGIGVLVGADEDISRGWAWEYREILHREVFDDFLDMADHLLKEGGYKEAAAVLAGGALEGHLRMLSQKHDIPISKVAAMNEALWKKDVYSKPTWRDVQAWYDLRTVAAQDTGQRLCRRTGRSYDRRDSRLYQSASRIVASRRNLPVQHRVHLTALRCPARSDPASRAH